MTRERGQGVVFLIVIVAILAMVGLAAVCTPGEDDDALGRVELASHDYCAADHDGCGGYGGGYYEEGEDEDTGRDKRVCFVFCDNDIRIPGLPGMGGGDGGGR